MNRIYPTLSFILLLGLHATPSFSQNDDFVKQFQQSRQAMLDDYNKFRNTILTDYDKYMQGVWKEYKKFKGDVRSQVAVVGKRYMHKQISGNRTNYAFA